MLDWGRRIEALESIVKELAPARALDFVSETINDVHDGMSRAVKTLLDRVEALDKDAVSFRGYIRDEIVRRKHEPLSEVVTDPIKCGNDHSGCLRVSVLEEVSIADPSRSTVIGGAFYCPICGDSFYYLKGRGRFKSPKQGEETGPGKPPPPPPPGVKFRGGRER